MTINRRSFLELLAAASVASCGAGSKRTIHFVPNFHPGCMGWLAPYRVERNYCLYAYLDHQDLALKDPDYRYVFSEIPHLITMLERRPDRFKELQELEKQGKTEMVNAFVVEPTVCLSGGEALVMQGVEGLRWYQQVMELKPRHCWMIDITGWHEQMAQIVDGLGLETFVYSRYNPTSSGLDTREEGVEMKAIHWLESPDGTRTLAVNPGHYSESLRSMMRTTDALPAETVVEQLTAEIEQQKKRFPEGAPLLGFAGQEDYSMAFNYKGYPAEALEIWNGTNPEVDVRFSTLSDWFDEFMPRVESGEYELVTVKSGSRIYGWTGFWVNAPEAKQWYRRCEHELQSAEALTTIASLKAKADYPTQDFSNGWLMLALNMDRAELWCVAVEGVYNDPRGWDIRDRNMLVDRISLSASDASFDALKIAGGQSLSLFNPSGWKRDGLVEVKVPAGQVPREAPAQLLEDGETALVRTSIPATGFVSLPMKSGRPAAGNASDPAAVIETQQYTAKVDPKTAALTSLKLKPSGRELLGGPANVVFADVRSEKDSKQVFAHEIPPKANRVNKLTSSSKPSRIKVTAGPLATIVDAECPFEGGKLRRVIRFYNDSPRIDFVTETNDLPHGTIVSAEFPLAGEITEIRRGIPYGFSHGAWSKPNPELHGLNVNILPVIRWSHYTLADGGGVALLDRGVPGRETVENTAIIVLHNATEVYYWQKNVKWMSGEGSQKFEYAMLAHDGEWAGASVPRAAWDYNARPLVFAGSAADVSYLEASPNLILQALRRTGDEMEIRVAEAIGAAGEGRLNVALPHTEAAITNMIGEERTVLKPVARNEDGAAYHFPVRPQQIVTLRLKTDSSVSPVKALTTFDPVVPEAKRAATRNFDYPELAGHPPRNEGDEEEWKKYDN